mgnify:CR=1 FL=1
MSGPVSFRLSGQPRVCGGRGRELDKAGATYQSAPRTRGSRRGHAADAVLGRSRQSRTPTARGSGATGRGLGLLHRGRGFVQYAQPPASRSPPSWSGPARGRRPGLSRRRTTAGRLRRNQKGPGRGQAGEGGAGLGERASGSATKTSRSQPGQRSGVHGADISGPAVGAPDVNRWNSRAPSRLATSARR